MRDEDEFDLRRYFLDIDDPEERARTIHESGWGGHPDFEDIERAVARFGGGTYQGLLAALQPVKETKSSDLTAKHVVRLYNAIAICRSTLADPLDQNGVPDPRVKLHCLHPPPPADSGKGL
jgi:hypothetical protein